MKKYGINVGDQEISSIKQEHSYSYHAYYIYPSFYLSIFLDIIYIFIYLVTSDASSGTVRVEQGSTVTIQCSASGNPHPHVYWYRQHINKVDTDLYIFLRGR